MSKDSFDPSDVSDREALLAMFRRIPIGMLETTAHRLLNASRTVRTSKATKMGEDGVERPDTVQEPDYQVQLKAFEIIVTQRVGNPSARKPIEPVQPTGDERPEPGMLKAGKSAPKRPTS